MAQEQLIVQPDDVTENPYREGAIAPTIREEPKEEPEEAEALEVVEAREMVSWTCSTESLKCHVYI